ncbi:histidine phosphatase family protein [Chelatococcus sp. SYSU_G07232]|uniref:Histidine phosphatase family protein n=1 Tax=Chelatococcus albus TaxID=3047466 RepID=A0ABT7AEE5_9HYPH|nr:histidine phosphatase family protein [Chelatococcus sp. SYSU_G07232]MDJ1157743.1 histidine phosphatase family protein [Chelatococcus sp. SYSU_G07232]
MTRPTVYFVRHGETDWNAEGRLQGTRDVPLNDVGREQAARAGALLQKLGLGCADLDFVASPMLRTRETIEGLRGAIGLDPHDYDVDERLREIAFGQWEGLTWGEIRARDPQGHRASRADRWHYVPPGGESYAMLAERVRPFMEGLTRDTVVVSHGGVARALLALFAGAPKDEAPGVDIWQGRILVFAGGAAEWVPAAT